MDWKKNFDFSPSRKVPPQKGRRAANALGSSSRSETSVAEDVLDSPPGSAAGTGPKSKSPLPVAPPRARRTGGWAEDTTKSGKRRSAVNVIEQERFRDVEDKKVDSDDDIPVIPDLDDLQEEELGLQVADAPSMAVNRVAMYKELNSDLLKHSVFSTLDGINLQLLTKRLSGEADVKEVDEVWTWEQLFTEVSSELHKEWELQTDDGNKTSPT
ncbi:intraflagellar transport protein 43 homolog A isoform X1 [Bacillus rossius redtenbacheri]|uniref:intraflagellar transport protein 43 homolog A isoform X1 n=1 Tax=Bacillus rossius redtenbacheri TaxID=93214 RepID=UPI002FDCB8F4